MMKAIWLIGLGLLGSRAAGAQAHEETVDSTAVPGSVRAAAHGLARVYSDALWHKMQEGDVTAYRVECWVGNTQATMLALPDGRVMAYSRAVQAAQVPAPARQAIEKHEAGVARDFGRTTLDITEHFELGKTIYGVIYYIPFDGSNWTRYDHLYFDEKGRKVQSDKDDK